MARICQIRKLVYRYYILSTCLYIYLYASLTIKLTQNSGYAMRQHFSNLKPLNRTSSSSKSTWLIATDSCRAMPHPVLIFTHLVNWHEWKHKHQIYQHSTTTEIRTMSNTVSWQLERRWRTTISLVWKEEITSSLAAWTAGWQKSRLEYPLRTHTQSHGTFYVRTHK